MLNTSDILKNVQLELASLSDKQNFKIGEVASFLGVKTHVLRYWEDEFSLLKPQKFINNQRLYRKKDVELLLLIKHLLHNHNLSVRGLRKNLSSYYQDFNSNKKQQGFSKQTQKKYADDLAELLEKIQETRTYFQNLDI